MTSDIPEVPEGYQLVRDEDGEMRLVLKPDAPRSRDGKGPNYDVFLADPEAQQAEQSKPDDEKKTDVGQKYHVHIEGHDVSQATLRRLFSWAIDPGGPRMGQFTVDAQIQEEWEKLVKKDDIQTGPQDG